MREVRQGDVVRVSADLGDNRGQAVRGGEPVQVLHDNHRGQDGRPCVVVETRDRQVLEVPRDAIERRPRR